MEKNTKRWRITGTALGFLLGGVAAAGIELAGGLFNSGSSGRDAAAASVWAACTTGGFFMGRAADQRTFTVLIRAGD